MSRRSSFLRRSLSRLSFWLAVALALVAAPATAQVGTVESRQKISETRGGFEGNLVPGDRFGESIAALGDLDGDGIGELAVGAIGDDDGGSEQGAVWVLFLNSDAPVASERKISETTGGFGGALDPFDSFGIAVAGLGDLDGDGIGDLAVGAEKDDDGGSDQGAVWILFLNSDGSVASEQKISETAGGFGVGLDPFDFFGSSVAALGDLDGDGNEDLAVGARQDDDGGANLGAVWILFLSSDGTVSSRQKISATAGGFDGDLGQGGFFYSSLAALGDLDGDGVTELAVGNSNTEASQGSVWILFLNPDGTVASERKISETSGGFGGSLDPSDSFGKSVTALGDLDGSGAGDLAVGTYLVDDGGESQGAVWILFLNPDGTVAYELKISEGHGGFGVLGLDPSDFFGVSVAALGDLDGDGIVDLAVGAHGDDDGNNEQGAVWILHLEGPDTTPPTIACPGVVSRIDRKTSPPGEVVFFSATATDDVDPAPAVISVPPSGSFFPRGTSLVTCTATDASGNQSVCTFTVVVTPPIRRVGEPTGAAGSP